jgi:hypothetical protein
MSHQVVFLLIFALILPLMPSVMAGETPDAIREKGFVALKAAQDDPDRIIEAAKYLAEAASAYQLAGDDKSAQETESYLFWAKKKMTIQQIDAFVAKDGAVARKVVEKLEAVEKKEVKPEDAALWMARADGYAEGAKDPFLVAVRYFEVASRFKGTPEGEKALEKSLAALQNAKVPASGPPIDKNGGQAQKHGLYAELSGTWTIAYKNNAVRVYTIEAAGSVSFKWDTAGGGEKKAILKKSPNGDVLIDFNDGKLETIRRFGTDILIQHFNPKTGYPSSPPLLGVGKK